MLYFPSSYIPPPLPGGIVDRICVGKVSYFIDPLLLLLRLMLNSYSNNNNSFTAFGNSDPAGPVALAIVWPLGLLYFVPPLLQYIFTLFGFILLFPCLLSFMLFQCASVWRA